MSMLVNYEDVCLPETFKATVVKGQNKNCYIKLSVFQTGFIPYSDADIKDRVEECRQKEIALASVSFKIMNHTLTGENMDITDQEQVAKSLVAAIKDRVLKRPKDADNQAQTSIPYFDINFFNIQEVFLNNEHDHDKLLVLEKTKSQEIEEDLPELTFGSKRRNSIVIPEHRTDQRRSSTKISVSELATQLIAIVNSHKDTTQESVADEPPANKAFVGIEMSEIYKYDAEISDHFHKNKHQNEHHE